MSLYLFDLDGTIVKTDHLYFDIWKTILDDHGIVLTIDLFKDNIQGSSDDTVIRNFGISISDISIISQKKDNYIIDNIDKILLVEGSIDFLKTIKKRSKNNYICIVTNCNRPVAHCILNKLISDYGIIIDDVVIGNECTRPKPYPDPYQTAINKINGPKKVFIFEDSKSGFLSASGTYPNCLVGITTNYNKEELGQYKVDIAIDTFNELSIDLLLSFKKNYDLVKFIHDSLSVYSNTIKKDTEIIMGHGSLKGGFIADVNRVFVNKVPMIIKIENKNLNNLSNMANSLALYEREYYFYDTMHRYMNISVPKFYALIKDESFENFGILMEDLSNLSLSPNLNKEHIDVSLLIIKRFAAMHKKFWNKNLKKTFQVLKMPNECSVIIDKVRDSFEQFKKLKFINQKEIRIVDSIVKNFDKIENYLSNSNLTFLHGDIKSANIFIDKLNGNEPYFIDWQYIGIGKGAQDLVFFLIESYSIEKINQCYKLFTEYYYSQIIENQESNKSIIYSKIDFEIDLKYSMCYFPFFVAMWFGTVNQDELIDKNFPYFFIKKLFNFYELFNVADFLENL